PLFWTDKTNRYVEAGGGARLFVRKITKPEMLQIFCLAIAKSAVIVSPTLVGDWTTGVGTEDGDTEALKARTQDYGDSLDQGRLLGPRNSGVVSLEESAGIYDHSDDGYADGSQEDRESCQEDRHFPH